MIGAIVAVLGPLLAQGAALSAETAAYCARRAVPPVEGRSAASDVTAATFPDGRVFCAWTSVEPDGGHAGIAGNVLLRGAAAWPESVVLVDTPGCDDRRPVLYFDDDKVLWLFYQTAAPGAQTAALSVSTSRDGGYTWSEPRTLIEETALAVYPPLLACGDGTLLLPALDQASGAALALRSTDGGATWQPSAPIAAPAEARPAFVELDKDRLACYLPMRGRRRLGRGISRDAGATWGPLEPCPIPNPGAPVALLRVRNGQVVLAHRPGPEDLGPLCLWASRGEGGAWAARRTLEQDPGAAAAPVVVEERNGLIHVLFAAADGGLGHAAVNGPWLWEEALTRGDLRLSNVLPPLWPAPVKTPLPIEVGPFIEHVRRDVPHKLEPGTREIKVNLMGELLANVSPAPQLEDGSDVNDLVEHDGLIWCGSDTGLFVVASDADKGIWQSDYGVGGPLASAIKALAAAPDGAMWVGTPLGLSVLDAGKQWRHIRGREGLPVEDVTALAADATGRIWIGTPRGAVLHDPNAEGRQWFYRAGPRYLPDDRVLDIALHPSGMPAYFLTETGIGCIEAVETTLEQRARTLERRVNERHRRLGLVAACTFKSAEDASAWTIRDYDNDGLWTAYHVAAMALCYAATGEAAALASAQKSMEALYMLQNASGTPGLVARSVVPAAVGKTKDAQWRPTPDGDMYWKSDTSSDEIDGHFLAFYTYWEHIAQYDANERARLLEQVRAVTDYIVNNGYQLIDWDGERTTWGFWDPQSLNHEAEHYLENGLNSLQMLSFLKVAHYITGDAKYHEHYCRLITQHGYLDNVLLEKKLFPDEHNYSDNQLAFVAWYPLLQLEHDPRVRRALLGAVRRHYEVVRPERASFFTFVFATIDPGSADLEGAVANLKRFPTDRRDYPTRNAERDDVTWARRLNRFGERVLDAVLPVDERNFDKWNCDPYEPDPKGSGRVEDDGAAYLLPYWMARWHGFVAEAKAGNSAQPRLP